MGPYGQKYDVPTILIAEKVGGEEEIPEGAGAVLTRDMPDVLSHSAVRARNEAVCLATCFDESVFAELQSMDGELISVRRNIGNLPSLCTLRTRTLRI